MSYERWRTTRVPGWLQGPAGTAWLEAHGAVEDDELARAKRAVKLGHVLACPPDALGRHGDETGIDRAPGEAVEGYRLRLWNAWDAWDAACTREGIVSEVALLQLGRPALLTPRELPVDALPQWARFALVWSGVERWSARAWGAFTWGARRVDPLEGALSATTSDALRRVLRQWISARDRVTCLIVARGSPLWGRSAWGRFVWGAGLGAVRVGPHPWGGFRWGAPRVPFGFFC